MKCIDCGACIRCLGKHKIQCSYTKFIMDEKTEQPKWCKDGHKTSELQHGIILDDDGYVFTFGRVHDKTQLCHAVAK